MKLPPQPNLERLWTGEVGRENVEEAESMIKKWREERREFSLIFGESAHVSSVLDDFQAAPSLHPSLPPSLAGSLVRVWLDGISRGMNKWFLVIPR